MERKWRCAPAWAREGVHHLRAFAKLGQDGPGLCSSRCQNLVKRAIIAGALSLMAACAPTEMPSWITAPADPYVGARAPRYAPVLSGVKNYRVVEPKDWRDLNRDVTPRPGGGATHPTPGTRM